MNYLTDGEGAAYFYNSDGRRTKGKVENYYYLPDCSEKDTDSINRGGMIQPIGCHFLTEDDEKVWNDNWINSRAEASSVRVDAQEVPVNGNWYEYKISEGEYVYCPIVIKDNGRLDVSVQINFEGHHYVGLLDQNYEAVRRDSVNPPEEEPEPEIAIPKIEIAVGETTELTTDSSSDNISWGSTDPSVIVVSNTGTVMGLKSGTAWVAGIPTDGSPIILYQILVQ